MWCGAKIPIDRLWMQGHYLRMDSNEFRATQAKIGCTGIQLARWIGVTDETVTRYRTGKSRIPAATAQVVRLLATGWRPDMEKAND